MKHHRLPPGIVVFLTATLSALPAAQGLTFVQVAKLTAADGALEDAFGQSVALSGNTALIGAFNDDDLGSSSGSAYTFRRDSRRSEAWSQVAKLTASDGAAGDAFGESVALSGGTAVVGAPGDDDLGDNSGAAYVFRRNAGGPDTSDQVAKLTAADGAAYDYFGSDVAVSGDTVIVAAATHRDDFGAAYVFERDAGGPDSWGQVAELTPLDGRRFQYFGSSVALSGDTAIVGAWGDDDLGSQSGAAYVFRRNAGGTDAWGQVAKLTAADGAPGDQFGASVAVSGDTAVVGAQHDSDLGFSSGSAYIFRMDAGGTDAWGQVAKLTAADGAVADYFGESVALSGDLAVVGASLDDDLGEASGSAYVFRRDAGGPEQWGQVSKLTADDGQPGDEFGVSLALDGGTLVVGAREYFEDPSVGSAYVFSLDCVLSLRLEPSAVRAGEALRIEVFLEHNRAETVTVPLRLWVEDAAGGVLAGRTTTPLTFERGDSYRRELTVSIPEATTPGPYRVLIGIEQMQQGLAAATQPFEVVAQSALPVPR